MPRITTGYDDELTEDELKALREHEGDDTLPPPDDQEGASTDGKANDGDDDHGGEDDQRGQDQQQERQQERQVDDAAGDEAGELAAFLERHKGKSPEEIAKIAFQQSKRAGRAEFSVRETQTRLTTVLDRIQQARDQRLAQIGERREQFRDKLEKDPDAALLEAREATLAREEQEAIAELDQEEFRARADAAIELAASAIPDFANRAPRIRQFGVDMGFSPEEVDRIVDGRQIVTLHLASIAGNLIRAGVMDAAGNFIGLPEPSRDAGQDGGQGGGRTRPGFGKTPARGAGTTKTIDDRLAEVSKMSDKDFDKLTDEQLDALLREAELG